MVERRSSMTIDIGESDPELDIIQPPGIVGWGLLCVCDSAAETGRLSE